MNTDIPGFYWCLYIYGDVSIVVTSLATKHKRMETIKKHEEFLLALFCNFTVICAPLSSLSQYTGLLRFLSYIRMVTEACLPSFIKQCHNE